MIDIILKQLRLDNTVTIVSKNHMISINLDLDYNKDNKNRYSITGQTFGTIYIEEEDAVVKTAMDFFVMKREPIKKII